MKNKNVGFLFLLFFLPALFFSSCTRNIVETKLENKNAKIRILIASDSSDYKDKIRNRVIDKYTNQASIDLVNIESLDDIVTEKYKAIFLIDTTMGWTTFNPSIKDFIEEHEDKKKIVLFMTAADPEFEFSYEGVDAITSASEPEYEEKTFQSITDELDKIILQ